MLAPRRRRGTEILDDSATPSDVRARSLRDVARSNALLGGMRAVLRMLGRLWPSLGASVTILDVGTGSADIPRRLRERARRRGIELVVVGVDEAPSLLGAAAGILDAGVCGDARRLPFQDAAVQIVICSQLLHHFEDAELPNVLRELDRVASEWVVVSDLRRSWIAACGFWLLSWPLGFHRVTRHDGFVSVLRGFTAPEMARLVRHATGQHADVRRHLGFRLTAVWRARAASTPPPPVHAG